MNSALTINPFYHLLHKFGRLFLLSIAIFLLTNPLLAADRYWVGGSGNWDAANTTNWSTTAGGGGGASVPTAADNVFFAAPLAASTVVTIVGAANCANFQWSLAGGTLAGAAGSALNIAGNNFVLTTGMTWTYAGDVAFNNAAGSLTAAGVSMTANLIFNSAGGWIINDNFINTGNVTGAAGANLTLLGTNNQLGGVYNVSGITTLGVSTITVFSGNANRTFGTVTLRASATLTMQTPATSSDNFGTINLTDLATMRFSGRNSNPTLVSGRLIMNRSDCNNGNNGIVTSASGVQTQVNFQTVQDWYNTNVSQLQNTNAGSVTIWTGSNSGNPGFVNNISVPIPNLYWTGAAGAGNTNWSDCRNWATVSGGAAAGSANITIPTRTNNVFFDNNSFAVSPIVTINTASACRTLDATTLGSPMQLAATANDLEIYGNLALSSNFDLSAHTGTISFLSNGAQTITMAGRSISRARFGDPSAGSLTGNWVVQDNFTALGAVTLIAGTLNTNSRPFAAASLNANPTGIDENRSLVLGASAIQLTGSGASPVLDLRSTNNVLIFNNPVGTATINFTANANVVVETGASAKVIPNAVFSNITTGIINLNTSNTANRITFGNLTVAQSAAAAGSTVLNVNGSAPKTFGAISLAQNVNAVFNGTTVTTPGNNNIINGAIDFAGGNDVSFQYSFTLNSTLTLAAAAASQVRFGNAPGDNATVTNHTFVGPILINGNGHLIYFDQPGNNSFQGSVTATGTANRFSLRNNGNNTFAQPVNTGTDAIWQFNACPTCLTTINSTFVVAGSCTTVAQLQSANLPVAGVARVDFTAGPYNFSYVDVTNLNNSIAPPVNVVIGGSVTNSVGFTAIPGNPRTLYWVNGSGNWTDTNHWSASGGGPSGQCVPRDIDNVIFDNLSNPVAAAFDITISSAAACANMEWRNTDAARIPSLRTGGPAGTLRITGNWLILDNNALANNVDGTFAAIITLSDPVGVPPILARTLRFADDVFGSITFDGVGAIWTIDASSGPFVSSSDIYLSQGTLNTNSIDVRVQVFYSFYNTPRTLNLGNTVLTVAGGGGTIVDLRGTNFAFPTPGPNARIDFTSTNLFSIELVNIVHELPQLNFTATGNAPAMVNINTGVGTNRVTFREITIANDRQGLMLNINGITPKTFSRGLSFSTNLANLNNTLLVVAPPTVGQENIFAGLVELGNVAIANSLSSVEFRGGNIFNAPFNVLSSPGAGVRFTQSGANTFANTLLIASGTVISFQNNNGQNLYQNLNLGGSSTFEFTGGAGASSRVQGNILFTGADCQRTINLRGVLSIATVTFDNADTWNFVRVQFLNFLGATITVAGIENLGNNSGTVIFTIVPRTLYWVGGTVGKTPSSFNWSDPNNWRTVSGAVAGPGVCPPTSIDDVIFDNNSFSAGLGANEVLLNAEGVGANAVQPVCLSMRWLGNITSTPRLKRSSAVSLGIYGSLTLQPPALMQTDGYAIASENVSTLNVVFNAATIGNTITTGGHILSAAIFNNVGEWQLQDPLTTASLLQIWGGVVYTYNPPATGATVYQPVTTPNLNLIGGTFNMGRSQVNLLGNVFDFSGGNIVAIDDNVCGTLADNAGRFVFTASGNILLNVGNVGYNFPDFNITGLTAGNSFTVNSLDTNRLVFRDVFVAQNGIIFNMNGVSPKTFGRISFQNNTRVNFNGTTIPLAGWSSPTVPTNINIFQCDVSFGTGTNAVFNNTNRFMGNFTATSTTAGANAVRFSGSNVFNQQFTVTASPGNVTIGQSNTEVNRFQGAFALNGAPNNLNVTGTANTGPAGVIFENTVLVNSTQLNQTTANFAASVEFKNNVSWGSFAGGTTTNPLNFEGPVDMYDGNGDGFGAPTGRLFQTGTDSRLVFGSDLILIGVTPPNAATGQRADFRNLELGLNTSAQFNGLSTYDNLILKDFSSIEFANGNNVAPALVNTNEIREQWNTDISGDQTCAQGAIRIASNRFGVQAHLRVNRNHDADDNINAPTQYRRLRNTLVRDLNKVGLVAGDPYLAAVPVTRVQVYPGDIANVANNTEYVYVNRASVPVVFSTSGAGIDFNPVEILPLPPRQTYYWVRSPNQRTGVINNASGGWGDLGNDNHWAKNDPNGLPSGCIPTAYDSVVFYNFGADAANVTALSIVDLNRFNLTTGGIGMTPTSKLFRFIGTDDVSLRVFGAHYVDPAVPVANLDNQFLGTVEYTGYNASVRVPGAGGAVKELRTGDRFRFAGPVLFNSNLDRWVLRDHFDINGGTRGDLTIAYGILDAGDADGAPANPYTISLEGDWRILARTTANQSSALRRPLFIPRRSTVSFDGNGYRQTIQLDDQTKANPVTTDGLATATDCVECTQYVVGAQAYPNTEATDPATGNRSYGGNPYTSDTNDPLIAANLSAIIACSRSPFYNLEVNKPYNANSNNLEVQLQSIISIYNDLRLTSGQLNDNGQQIRGNYYNPINVNGGSILLANNTCLLIGTGNQNTVFPTCYRSERITLSGTGEVYTPDNASGNYAPVDPTAFFGRGGNNPSIVQYNANIQQLVAGPLSRSSIFPLASPQTISVGPATYGSLVITTNTAGGAYKDLGASASVTVNGTFFLHSGIFRDFGNQVLGNGFANQNASGAQAPTNNKILMGPNNSPQAVLYLGTGNSVDAVSSIAPSGLVTLIAPAGITLPTSALNRVTGFPTFTPVGDYNSTNPGNGGKMQMGQGLVIYAAGSGEVNLYPSGSATVVVNLSAPINLQPVQEVLAGFSYWRLQIRNDLIPITRKVLKRVINPTIVPAGVAPPYALVVLQSLEVQSQNNLYDNGIQITSTPPAQPQVLVLANAQLTLGNDNIGTNFSPQFVWANTSLDPNSTVMYLTGHFAPALNATGARQLISSEPNYGNLEVRDFSLGSNPLIRKELTSTPAFTMQGNLLVGQHNLLADTRNQLRTTGVGKLFTLENGNLGNTQGQTHLELGLPTVGGTATNLPTGFANMVINDSTTVIYNDANQQNVGLAAQNSSFWNLFFAGDGATAPSAIPDPLGTNTKRLLGTVGVRNAAILRPNVSVYDNGFQISGNANVSANPLFIMSPGANLMLGNAATTIFPTQFIRGRIALDRLSTVFYQANLAQDVSNQPSYGNLIARRFDNSVATLINKTVQGAQVDVPVRAQLRIEDYNHLIDNGNQILGNSTDSLTMANTGRLTLGTPTVATLFPTAYRTNLINLYAWTPGNLTVPLPKTQQSTVVYNANSPTQVVAGPVLGVGPGAAGTSPSAYGNVELRATAAVTKSLVAAINVRGSLIIGDNNTLDANPANYNINLGGDWVAENGGAFTARAAQVVFDGMENEQIVRSNNQSFYNAEVAKLGSVGVGFSAITLDFPLRITNLGVFTRGHFASANGREVVFAPGAGVAGGGSGFFALGYSGSGTPPALTLTDGPTDASHVIGPVLKEGNTAFFFPIGNGRRYAPLAVSQLTNPASAFRAAYYGFGASTVGADVTIRQQPPLVDVSNSEFWTLDRKAGADQPNVTLTWENVRSGNINQPSATQVAQWYNRPSFDTRWWTRAISSYVNSSFRGAVMSGVVVDNIDNPSDAQYQNPFTIASESELNLLPIQLLRFEAKADPANRQVQLHWATAQEVENAFFTLERSTDGRNFAAFKQVPGAGNSSTRLDYREVDTEPLPGLSYYRLKQTDRNGTFTYSKIVAVLMEEESLAKEGFVLYPNPNAGNEVNLLLTNRKLSAGRVILYDITGRELFSERFERNGTEVTMRLTFRQALAAGTYVLRIMGNDGGIYQKKMVVQ